jgi:hypothetical protein
LYLIAELRSPLSVRQKTFSVASDPFQLNALFGSFGLQSKASILKNPFGLSSVTSFQLSEEK